MIGVCAYCSPASGRKCMARDPQTWASCTRPSKHEGMHVACGVDHVWATWQPQGVDWG